MRTFVSHKRQDSLTYLRTQLSLISRARSLAVAAIGNISNVGSSVTEACHMIFPSGLMYHH